MRQETRLFVGNLPHDVDEVSLRARFSLYGDIVNLELKSKNEENAKKFAFITLSTNDKNVDSCISHFSKKSFQNDQIYVSRARESFLERLQRERLEELAKAENEKLEAAHNSNKHSKKVEKDRSISPPNHKKRKLELNGNDHIKKSKKVEFQNLIADAKIMHANVIPTPIGKNNKYNFDSPIDSDKMSAKKMESNKKRLESMKQKLKEFKQKKNIIKSGLFGVDAAPNKKVVFNDSDNEGASVKTNKYETFDHKPKRYPSKNLFDGGDSDDDINFEIKKQFEGRNGQKVLELQSKYKSDKRFVLDERFHDGLEELDDDEEEQIETSQLNEKDTQMNILQDVLGVSLTSVRKPAVTDSKKKIKSKIGMLRFDPHQPEHSKFLAPVEEKKQEPIKNKKKKAAEKHEEQPIDSQEVQPDVAKVEVSKEQFYQVTDKLKEALVQTNSFSLRSLFKTSEENEPRDDLNNENEGFTLLQRQTEPKVRNPLDRGDVNPFKYDSSDSEDEETPGQRDKTVVTAPAETKAVWKESLFFTENDRRLYEGLSFFNTKPENESSKDRRGLKILMKKRINNKNRKEQMFKKKIGGRRKPFNKSTFRKH